METIIKSATIKPGSLVVFEGMDGTGKTTQLEKLRAVGTSVFNEPKPHFTHQPSGGTPVGNYVYQITEAVENMTPLTRQFLHLAAHADQWEYSLKHELSQRAVFMDRWWWSTLAYAEAGGLFQDGRISRSHFSDVVKWPLLKAGITDPRPDILFLFTDPYVADKNNSPELLQAYKDLCKQHKDFYPRICLMSQGTPDEVTTRIFKEMEQAGIAEIEYEEVEQ